MTDHGRLPSGGHQGTGDQHAPGLNTTADDVRAVLEAEGPASVRPAPGRIDDAARRLIDAARAATWRTATFTDAPAEGPASRLAAAAAAGAGGAAAPATVSVTANGAGLLLCQRTLPSGLVERIICDGRELLHVYDEIGLGSRRTLNRFHRQSLRGLMPWLVPAVEDLAAGADLTAEPGGRTVTITPRAAGNAATQPGQARPAGPVVRLTFGPDGGLAEREVLDAAGKRAVLRETLTADGTWRVLDAAGTVRAERKYHFQPAGEPDLKVPADTLVLLPMPLRTPWHVRGNLSAQPAKSWDAWDAMAVIAAAVVDNKSEERVKAAAVIRERFIAQGDRRGGLWVLLAAAGMGEQEAIAQAPDTAVVKYVLGAAHGQAGAEYEQMAQGALARPPVAGLVPRLAAMRALWRGLEAMATRGERVEAQRAYQWYRNAMDFHSRTGPTVLSWALLIEAAGLAGDSNLADYHRELAGAFDTFAAVPELAPLAAYEAARARTRAGLGAQAAQAYRDIYQQAARCGRALWFDAGMFAALGEAERQEMILGSARRLAQAARWAEMLELAWQCAKAGDAGLGQQVLALARAEAPPAERTALKLAAVKFHAHAGQWELAQRELDEALAQPDLAGEPRLWHAAARIAAQRGQAAKAVLCDDRAVALAYRQPGRKLDLTVIRADHQAMLARYAELATAVATADAPPPRELLAGVIRTADRWLSLDGDPKPACAAAAKALHALHTEELAWEYLTTPLAEHPSESGAWTALAVELAGQGAGELADRAYASAAALDAANPQILWDRAQLLLLNGRDGLARELFQQIAQGQWADNYRLIQQQARKMLAP